MGMVTSIRAVKHEKTACWSQHGSFNPNSRPLKCGENAENHPENPKFLGKWFRNFPEILSPSPEIIQFWDRAQELFAKVGQRATGNGIFEYNIWYIHIHWSILFSYYNNNPCNCITYIYIHIYMWLYIYTVYWLMYVYLGFSDVWLVMDHDLDTIWALMWTSNWESLDFPGSGAPREVLPSRAFPPMPGPEKRTVELVKLVAKIIL